MQWARARFIECEHDDILGTQCLNTAPFCAGARAPSVNAALGESASTGGYHAQVFVLAPLKCYVHISARAQAQNPGTMQVWTRPKISITGLLFVESSFSQIDTVNT